MNKYDRIAKYLKYKDWDTMIEHAKENDIKLQLPPYLFYGKFGDNFCNKDLFEEIKKINFKLIVVDDEVFLTRDKTTDTMVSINNDEEIT